MSIINTLSSQQTANGRYNKQNSNKLRGGYYTPQPIADFLSKWSIQKTNSHVLEPSCGDGQFLESLVKEYGNDISITAVELIPEEAKKASLRGNKKTQIIISDAFLWFEKTSPSTKFDAVIGNPPFIRYQNFPEEFRLRALNLMKEEGLSPSKLTNSWLPFVVLGTKALKKSGRLALVLPAELLQVSYARELRQYLSTKYKNLTIITFKRLVFPDIQQEVILLLGERGDCLTSNISLLQFDDLSDLKYAELETKVKQHKILDINHDNEKWTQFYLTRGELDLIRSIESSDRFIRLGDIAEVDVGVVTGNNSFFILDFNKASNLGLLSYCQPIIGRSNHLSGILFNQADYDLKTQQGEKMFLFNPGKVTQKQLNKAAINYIQMGENSGVVEGYKCRIRTPLWWNVPSSWRPDAFLLRQIHEGPKIIANLTDATSTDTVHRIKMKKNVSPSLLARISFNSLTFALAEIRGRSYGGGVLELEPTEAENLLLPNFDHQVDTRLGKIDQMVREKKIKETLDIIDSIYLIDCGLSSNEIFVLRNIWQKLKTRRAHRNHKSNDKNQSPESIEPSSTAWGGNPLYLEP